MKKGNSDHYPEITIMSNNFVQCRYDILSEMRTKMDGNQHQGYSYSYVEMKSENMNQEAIAQAILDNGYPGGEVNAADAAKTILTDWIAKEPKP